MKVSYTIGGVTFHFENAQRALEHYCFLAPELMKMGDAEDLESNLRHADQVLTAAGRLEVKKHPPAHYPGEKHHP